MSVLKRAVEVPGGLAEGKPDKRYDREQLAKGVGVEMEHTDDPEAAKDIAKDHLEENQDFAGQENEAEPYYDALAKQEEMAEAKHKGKPGKQKQSPYKTLLTKSKESSMKTAAKFDIPVPQFSLGRKQIDLSNMLIPNPFSVQGTRLKPGGTPEKFYKSKFDLGKLLEKLIRNPYPIAGTAIGGLSGLAFGGKHRLLASLIGALAGGACGYGLGKALPEHTMLPETTNAHPDYYGPGGWMKGSSEKIAVLGRAVGRLGAGGARIMRRVPKPRMKVPGLPARRMPARIQTPPAQRATMQALNRQVMARQAARAGGQATPSGIRRILPWATGGAGAGTLAYLTWLLSQGRQPASEPMPVAGQSQQPAPTVSNFRRAIR